MIFAIGLVLFSLGGIGLAVYMILEMVDVQVPNRRILLLVSGGFFIVGFMLEIASIALLLFSEGAMP